MKKLLLTLLTLCMVSILHAQLADGFYRIQGQSSKKYMALQNNHGQLIEEDGIKTSVDLSSLVMVDENSGVISDPATVFYIKRASGNMYDLKVQGANIGDICGDFCPDGHVTIEPGYYMRMVSPLATKTLGEKINIGMNNTVTAEGHSDFKWNILAVSNFGVNASIFNGTKYYAPFYASFAFTPSAGMKVYYVGEIDVKHSVVILDEITGTVPAGTPVIIECSSMLPELNKLSLLATGGTTPQINFLKGEYFNYPGYNNIQPRHTAYDPNTMRVLGLNDNNELVFKKATNQPYLLANQSYLEVEQGTADELRIMTRLEYKALPELTITINDATREYGLGNPVFTCYVQPKNTSGEIIKLLCSATQYSNVGTYDITLDESSLTNPKVNVINGTLTITQAKLTATTGNYERMAGEANPDMSYITYNGFRNNENETAFAVLPTVTCSATPESKGGQYDVVVSGGQAENYDFEYVFGKLTIYDFAVKVSDATRKYGEPNPTFTYTHMGELSGAPIIDTPADAYSSVGTYPINIERGSIENPWLKYEGATLTITPAEITPQFDQADYYITVGDPLPNFNVSYYGFANDDTPNTVIITHPSIRHSCKVDAQGRTLEVGTYRCSFGADGRTKDGNYTFKTNASVAWLHVVEVPPVIVKANNFTRVYGEENPEFTYNTEGGTLNGNPEIACSATTMSPVGTYPIVVTKGDITNNNNTYVNGTLTIIKAPLAITANSYTIKQGDSMSNFSVNYEGFKNGEDNSVLTTQPRVACSATSSSMPGTYDIIVYGAAAENYDISYNNGKLTIDGGSFTLTYQVDGEVYKTVSYDFGAPITPETIPTKEGYTFSGWSWIPTKMPSENVVVTGSFTVNIYKLTYKVDGEVYKTIDVAYGAAITAEADPIKAGYKFSGWSTIPATMPSEDITITGSFEKFYDVGDLTGLLKYIMNRAGGVFSQLFDLNGDGELNIGDIVLMVKKIHQNQAARATARARAVNSLSADVDLSQYTAVQFILSTDEQAKVSAIRLKGKNRETHRVSYEPMGNGQYSVVVYSTTNQLLTVEEDGLLEVELADGNVSSEITTSNVVLSTPDSECLTMDSLPTGATTGINSLDEEADGRDVYNLNGSKEPKQGLRKGIYIIRGKKTVVR